VLDIEARLLRIEYTHREIAPLVKRSKLKSVR
jgi:hypothetical protein